MLTIDYELLDIRDGERVLDIGCGEGRHSWEACKRTNCLVYALDIEPESLNKARWVLEALDREHQSRGRWLLVKGSAVHLPFRDGSFDKVICSEVLEHLPDDRQGLSEIVRVLKDGGIAAISVPTYLPETICWKLSREYHDRPRGHVRVYHAQQLARHLSQNNLHVYITRYKHALHSVYWILRCIFGVNREKAPVPALYHRFLVWDIKTRSRPVRWLEDFLNRLFPKSVVFYASKDMKGVDGTAEKLSFSATVKPVGRTEVALLKKS